MRSRSPIFAPPWAPAPSWSTCGARRRSRPRAKPLPGHCAGTPTRSPTGGKRCRAPPTWSCIACTAMRSARRSPRRSSATASRRAISKAASRSGWRTRVRSIFGRSRVTRWVTRERPKIDRIACPWLISRFVDRDAEFLYVPSKQVRDVATVREAVPYDVPEVYFTHQGELCSFDAFIKHYRLGGDPALARLALVVRGADTAKLDLAPQAPGLAAVSLGLSRIFLDDHEMLKHGMVLYDALYAWCKDGQDDVHTWNPEAYR